MIKVWTENLFFQEGKSHFFRPLTGKYREKARACIKDLYLRLNGPTADCRYHLSRKDILQAFTQQLANTPELDEDSGSDSEGKLSDDKLARRLFDSLKESGWIEEYQDDVQMRTAYRFTPDGRLFAKAFVDVGRERFRASHRNTRNTRNALSAYFEHRDPHDLIEAYSFAHEIFNDFNESLEEIVLMQQRQARAITERLEIEQASEDFFDYLEKRFMPDISKMMGAESVSRYRVDILEITGKIRTLDQDHRVQMELALRSEYPMLAREDDRPTLYWILEQIERRIENACDIKLPELRRALETFTRRSHMIIQQLMRIHAADHQDIGKLCRILADQDKEVRQALLEKASDAFGLAQVRLVNPAGISIGEGRTPAQIDTKVVERSEPTQQERLEAQIARALDSAFSIEDRIIAKAFYELLRDSDQLRSKFLTITNVDDLYVAMHALTLASNNHDLDVEFEIEETGNRLSNDFFEGNDYRIHVRRKSA